MNLRMMYYGRAMATDGTDLNDQMTRTAVTFMESQISDPELREKVRPNSKCKQHGLEDPCCYVSSTLLMLYRLLQTSAASGQLLPRSCED